MVPDSSKKGLAASIVATYGNSSTSSLSPRMVRHCSVKLFVMQR